MKELISHQRDLFAVLEEFFKRATGTSPEKFSPLSQFAENVKSLASRATEVQKAFEWAEPELNRVYRTAEPYRHAAELGGIKAVMGGGAHFGKTQFAAAKRMILYTDTVLIPDPVFALIEAKRPEERFHSVRILEAMFLFLGSSLSLMLTSASRQCSCSPVLIGVFSNTSKQVAKSLRNS